MVEPVRWPCGKDDEDAPAMGPARLAEEREKHRKRSERFGIEFRDVGHRRDLRDEARKERLARPGFVTGMDLFSEEAREKRRKRAERFGTADNSEDMEPKLLELPEQERAKRRRAEKFGLDYSAPEATMSVDLQEERSDVPMEVPRRYDALHVYGVDLMSTADVLEYWSSYGPTYVEWINDSCCNVCFADQYTAVRAIVGMGAALPPDGTPDGQGGLTAMDVSQVAVLWHKGPDFVKDGVPVPLLFRLATIQDKKDLNRSIADIAKSRWARRRRPPHKVKP